MLWRKKAGGKVILKKYYKYFPVIGLWRLKARSETEEDGDGELRPVSLEEEVGLEGGEEGREEGGGREGGSTFRPLSYKLLYYTVAGLLHHL